MTEYILVYAFLAFIWLFGFTTGMYVEHIINERKRKKQE